jgi:hypothetical protein
MKTARKQSKQRVKRTTKKTKGKVRRSYRRKTTYEQYKQLILQYVKKD